VKLADTRGITECIVSICTCILFSSHWSSETANSNHKCIKYYKCGTMERICMWKNIVMKWLVTGRKNTSWNAKLEVEGE